MMKANKQIGFIYKNEESIDKILKDGEVVFERGFLREKTSTTLPITFGGVGKDLKDYRVYGNTYQNSTTGKNLFDINEYSNAILRGGGSAVDFTKENDTTLKILNKISQVNNFCGIPIPNSENLLGKTITASVQVELNNVNNTKMQFYFLSNTSVTTAITTAKSITSDGTYQLTATIPSSIPSGSTRIGLVIYGSNTAQPVDSYVLWENIQLEENSSVTPYEPYTGGQPSPNPDYPQEIISCGDRTKNLFDKNNANIINGYIQANTGKIISGNSDLIAYIKCKPNTQYSFQRMQIGNNKGRFRVGTTQTIPIADMTVENFYYKGNSEYSTNKLDGYVTNANAKYLLFYFSQITGMSQSEIDTILGSIQIEENPIATEYEPYYNGYKIPINVNGNITNIYLDEPLRKIGEHSDYIDFINGKVVRKIYEYKITGNENWKKTYGNNLFNIDRMFNDKPFIPSYGLCNMYKYNSIQSGINANTVNGEFALQKSVFSEASVAYNLFIKNTSYSDKDLFKTYLQNLYNNNTPVIINYPLETPTEEAITLPNIPTIEGNNTLNIETEITPSQVYIKYKSNN